MAEQAKIATPEYVHDLLDAFLSGQPLNFHRHEVPHDVRERLDAAKASGILTTVPADPAP